MIFANHESLRMVDISYPKYKKLRADKPHRIKVISSLNELRLQK